MASAERAAPVEIEVQIDADPETVFDFLVEPDKMTQWMGRRVELDPHPGGTFRCEINDRAVARGEYVAVERPERVVFTWGWEGEDAVTEPGSSTVEVLLTPGDGGTRLRLVHRDLPSAEVAERHREGWGHYAERLVSVASGRDPGPDRLAEQGSGES